MSVVAGAVPQGIPLARFGSGPLEQRPDDGWTPGVGADQTMRFMGCFARGAGLFELPFKAPHLLGQAHPPRAHWSLTDWEPLWGGPGCRQTQERFPGRAGLGIPSGLCRSAMPASPAPPGLEPPLPRWMRLLGAGLTALVAVLALVVLHQLQEQASRSQTLERRLQALENRRDLERTQALEAQLRAVVERLRGLEANSSQVQEFALQVEDLRRQLQLQRLHPAPEPPELLPYPEPAPPKASRPAAKPAAKPPAKAHPAAEPSP